VKIFLACVVVVGLVGATAAIASGGSSATALKASADFPTRAVHLAKVETKAAATYRYFETNPFTLNPGTERGAAARCPRRYSAVSGYWGSDAPGVVSDFNAVGNSARKWLVAVLNLDSSPHQAFVGVVCAHN
jgi:hypothetical protein